MARLYQYVGPDDIRRRAASAPAGLVVRSVRDLLTWLAETGQETNEGQIAVTFVVDELDNLRIAPRRSEHIACSGGQPVRSAGELFIEASSAEVRVVEVSNQSTGFCPEPESWPAVATALDRLGVAHPGRFTREVVFRRCLDCGQLNIVKDDWFECVICESELPTEWNCARATDD